MSQYSFQLLMKREFPTIYSNITHNTWEFPTIYSNITHNTWEFPTIYSNITHNTWEFPNIFDSDEEYLKCLNVKSRKHEQNSLDINQFTFHGTLVR